MSKKEEITNKAIEALKATPEGIRYSDLHEMMQKEFPDTPGNTINGTIWDLDLRLPNIIFKAARGLFRHVNFRETIDIQKNESIKESAKKHDGIREEDFYESFANWLVQELEECTKAIPLGGNKFRDKWTTPDVIGIRESLRGDIVTAPTEVISCEIKTDIRDLITAFGQASSYKLFSHKSIIVIPNNSPQDDIARIDSLCLILGIGLVLFDNENIGEPRYEIRVRPAKHDPDMFYVNKYMKLIAETNLFK